MKKEEKEDIEGLAEVNPSQESGGLAAKVEAHRQANELELATDQKYSREGEIFELGTVETKVQQLQQIAGQSIIEIGRLLAWTKERVGHGEFRESLTKINLSKTQANAYMQVYNKIGNNPNVRPVGHLGISKALELVRNYEEEELEALASGEEVAGRTLDELAGLSRAELKATLRREREATGKQLEAKDKAIDAERKRGDKFARRVELYESGSDKGWEFTAQWLEKMGAEIKAINSAAQRLEIQAGEWGQLVEEGDERAISGHPFIYSNFNQWLSFLNHAVDQAASALEHCSGANHPLMDDLQGVAMGFTRQNLPKSMKFTPRAVEESDELVFDSED